MISSQFCHLPNGDSISTWQVRWPCILVCRSQSQFILGPSMIINSANFHAQECSQLDDKPCQAIVSINDIQVCLEYLSVWHGVNSMTERHLHHYSHIRLLCRLVLCFRWPHTPGSPLQALSQATIHPAVSMPSCHLISRPQSTAQQGRTKPKYLYTDLLRCPFWSSR